MFELQLPAWELVVRAGTIYVALLAMMRLSGKRTVGQFTPFDLLVMLLLSEAVSQGLTAGEESITGALILAAVLILLNGLIGFIGSRSKRMQSLLEGDPVMIGRDGRWFTEVMKRHRLCQPDVEQALREADCSLENMKLATLEIDGSISILKR